MNQPIVCKFGGSSAADASCFSRIRAIVHANADRRYIVVSAPGKTGQGDKKVTDLLYACAAAGSQEIYDERFACVSERFLRIARALGLQDDIARELSDIRRTLPGREVDYAASRGEYLNARLLAACLDRPFLDAAEVIRFHPDGTLDRKTTRSLLAHTLGKLPQAVIPGFYGASADGRIHTFVRGGSDITGALIAQATRACLYENWTDVSGLRAANPALIPNAPGITSINYEQMELVARCGASLLHPECLRPVEEAGIPLHIRNTFAPDAPGTLITRDAALLLPCVSGISGVSILKAERTSGLYTAPELDRISKVLAGDSHYQALFSCDGSRVTAVCERASVENNVIALRKTLPGTTVIRGDGLSLAAVILPRDTAERRLTEVLRFAKEHAMYVKLSSVQNTIMAIAHKSVLNGFICNVFNILYT